MPRLSIITVNLNDKDGLINTTESVIAQTWTDYEWIIIDGGSTDGSVDVIKKYADKTDKLVYWCSEPDGGIYQGMNKGIEKASGEYCWFLNSGDYAYKNTTLAEIFANKFNEDIVYGDGMVCYGELPCKKRYVMIKSKNYKVLSLTFWVYNTIFHQASFVKKSVLVKLGGYDCQYKISADHKGFVEAIFIKNAKVRYIPAFFAVQSAGGISTDPQSAVLVGVERKKIMKKLFPKSYLLIRIETFLIKGWYLSLYNFLTKYLHFHPFQFFRGVKILLINGKIQKGQI